MIKFDLTVAGAYLFFITILLQNTVALAFVATGVAVPVSPFYAVKFLLLFAVAWLLLVTKTLPRLGSTERTALLIVLVVLLVTVAKGGGFQYEAGELEFYFVPILLFFVGRATAPFKNDQQMARLLMTLGILYVVLGTAYELIGQEALANGGLRVLLGERLNAVGRGDSPLINGLPENLWSFLPNGDRISRAFGALFEPLASAFFGVTLAFHLWEIHRRRVVAGAGLLAVAVTVLIGLSICRAVILGMILVFIASLIHKKGIIALPLWPVLVVSIAGVVLIFANLNTVLPFLDPSSGGHLAAYMNLNSGNSLISLFGNRFDSGVARGEESLYSTILFECGIVGLGCFVTWFVQLYFRIRKLIDYPYARAMFESMIVYIFASFTTEHWFAVSSCTLFWFLLGNNLTAIDQQNAGIDHESPAGAKALA
jgi:hypothetical protein